MNTTLPKEKILDVSEIPCSSKHAQILQRWNELAIGDHFILKNNHDPIPLRQLFDLDFKDAFQWEYLQRNEDGVLIQIARLAHTNSLDKFSHTSSCDH